LVRAGARRARGGPTARRHRPKVGDGGPQGQGRATAGRDHHRDPGAGRPRKVGGLSRRAARRCGDLPTAPKPASRRARDAPPDPRPRREDRPAPSLRRSDESIGVGWAGKSGLFRLRSRSCARTMWSVVIRRLARSPLGNALDTAAGAAPGSQDTLFELTSRARVGGRGERRGMFDVYGAPRGSNAGRGAPTLGHTAAPPGAMRTPSAARRARLMLAASMAKSCLTRSHPRTRARRPPCLRRIRWAIFRSTLGRTSR
jgi:hypothetical protein